LEPASMILTLLSLTLQQKIAMSETIISGVTDNVETVRVLYKTTPHEDKVTRECISQRLVPLEFLAKVSTRLHDEVKLSTERDVQLVDRDLRMLDVARSKSFELREQALLCRFGLAKGNVTTQMIQEEMDLVSVPSNPPDVSAPEASPN